MPSAVQYARAAYSAATRLALELKRYCAEHELSFAASFCLPRGGARLSGNT